MDTIEQFKQDFAVLRSEQAPLIETLLGDLMRSGKKIDSFFYEQIDELKGYLGMQVANEASDDPIEQEAAIAEAEDWVAENLSSEGYRVDIAITLYLKGLREGVQRLHTIIH